MNFQPKKSSIILKRLSSVVEKNEDKSKSKPLSKLKDSKPKKDQK